MGQARGIRAGLRRLARPGPVLALCLALSVISVAAGCLFGAFPVPAGEALGILAAGPNASAPADPAWATVVWDLRLPRACLAWLVGAALAVAGCVFQGILRNPLADPFTLGTASGAAFGAAMAIHFGLQSSAPAWAPWLDPLPAFGLAGAAAALAGVLLLARVAGSFSGRTLILAGVVMAAFLQALISLVKSLDEESVASIVFWIMGGFQGRGWAQVQVFSPYCAAGGAIVWAFSRELDLLRLGDTQARQLGVAATRARLWLLLGASLLTGGAVAISGIIGFVGLIVPHLVRLAIGPAHGPLLAASALVGGVLLLWSDVLARTILAHGAELPVGVVTALMGGPFFCALLGLRARQEG